MTKKQTLPVGFFMVFLTLLVGGFAWAAIWGSVHDMRSVYGQSRVRASDADSIYSACAFCHTPHKAVNEGTWRPLWNPHDTTVQPIHWNPVTTVRGDTLQNTMKGSTRACMGCHDGTVAMGDLNNYKNARKTATMISGHNNRIPHFGIPAGGDSISQNHPLGVTLPVAKAGFSSYNIPPTNALVATRYAGEGNMVNCATCHEVHNLYGYKWYLVANQAGDTLCLACHQL